MENQKQALQLSPRFKQLLVAMLGIPMAVSFLFTWMQWYPATYVINRIVGEDGTFSFKMAVFYNWVLLVVPLFIVTVIVLVIFKTIQRRRKS